MSKKKGKAKVEEFEPLSGKAVFKTLIAIAGFCIGLFIPNFLILILLLILGALTEALTVATVVFTVVVLGLAWWMVDKICNIGVKIFLKWAIVGFAVTIFLKMVFGIDLILMDLGGL